MQILRKAFSIIFCVCIKQFVYSSNIDSFTGAYEAGMSNASVSLPGIWPGYNNPAGIVFSETPVVAICYQNRYCLPELSTTSTAAIIPQGKGAFGISMSYFGTSRYNEQKYAAGYACKLSKKIQAGVMLNYFNAKLPSEYNTTHTLTGEIGVLAQPANKLNVGVHVFNITNSKYQNYTDECLPLYFQIGASWIDETFTISSQVQLNRQQSTILSVGAELPLVESLFFRAGVSSSEETYYSFGFGYNLNWLDFNIAFTHHPILGFSSFVSLQYHIGKSKL